MRNFMFLAIALSMATNSAIAAPCRDAHGKFMKCAPMAPQRCRDAKGRFAKCGPH